MLEIKVRNPGAELTSVKFNGKERLHDGKLFGIGKLQFYFQR